MLALKPAVASHPTLCVAVSRADDASSFLNHLKDDAAVDVAHNVGVIWPHDPTEKKRTSLALGVETKTSCAVRVPDSAPQAFSTFYGMEAGKGWSMMEQWFQEFKKGHVIQLLEHLALEAHL